MRPIVCVFDSSTAVNITRADVLHPSRLDSVLQRRMADICSASDTRLKMSAATTLHLHMGESYTRVSLGVLKKLVLLALLMMTYIDRFINSIHPVKRKLAFTVPPQHQY